jgi:hypothetical protein
LSECNDPIYPLPSVTELPKSLDKKGTEIPNVTDKTIPTSNIIETTEISDKSETEYQKIDVPYKKSKPQRTIIKAKII